MGGRTLIDTLSLGFFLLLLGELIFSHSSPNFTLLCVEFYKSVGMHVTLTFSFDFS